jgi:hypothetical protein
MKLARVVGPPMTTFLTRSIHTPWKLGNAVCTHTLLVVSLRDDQREEDGSGRTVPLVPMKLLKMKWPLNPARFMVIPLP